ncbi:MATE family efflux transporter [Sphaerochaeta globosa]|uniref:Multidrug-efflux transporter n=1 Tax=Sphaerochaeta globosa (strain ATCC BAA-1886 / DSM 22777 / Buddy) TaxID=158189 RepID=F0RRV1_SPHGB|nr:MATE family efflux transporter [Sphaerochaeta globosa]ADY14556.1 MATE efflux family protein [Sphaerochaeta globosa str. Buddy]
MGTHSKLMTTGSIQRNLLSFAIPLFLGNLFQQLYHTADSLVVGNFVGKESLAAISSIGSLTMLMIGLVQGIFVGAGVVISKAFGEGDKAAVQKAVHTTVALGLAGSVLLTLLGYYFAPLILIWMQTPASVFDDAQLYIRIYFLGVSSLILYNTASGILQAVGDSRHPLYFLIISAIINIVLDLVFVAVFDMGIAGTAYATIIAQGVSAMLSFRLLFNTSDIIKVRLSHIRFHKGFIGPILRLGVPSGIQNSVTSFANVILQSSINLFGPSAMAGNGAFMRIQGFAFIPITAFALALTTFTGQNLGAGEYERVRKGARFGVVFAMILAETIGALMYFGSEPLIALFSRDPEVLAFGVQKSQIASLFLWSLALSHAMTGIFRGAGKSIVPMSVMLAVWCIFRIIFIQVGLAIIMDIRVVYWAYPVTWTISAILFVLYYFLVDWMGQTK